MCYLDIYLAPKPSVLGKSVSALLRMGVLGFRVSLCLLILGERGESEHGWEDGGKDNILWRSLWDVSPVEIGEN